MMEKIQFRELRIDQVEANDYNPNVLKGEKFEALKEDMKAGNYDPILVSPKGVFYGGPHDGDQFVIVDGEFRWRAAQAVGLPTIKTEIQSLAMRQARSVTYKRNRERGELDPFKEAQLFDGEVRAGLAEEEVAERYGVSRSYVAGRRLLLNASPMVEQLYYEPESTLKEGAREKIRQSIEESVDTYDIDMTDGEVEEKIAQELEDVVPRGTLTPGHLKAIAGLPPEYQEDIATDVVQRDLTVRDTEEEAKKARDKIEKEERFHKALGKARQKTCPYCGADPREFEFWNEKRFTCRKCFKGWNYMVTKEELEKETRKRDELFTGTKTKELKEARENPAYVRRLETVAELEALIRPWVLRKLHQLDSIEDVTIVGYRGDQAIRIVYPGSWSKSLTFATGPKKRPDDPWNRWIQQFSFSMEDKAYKTLDAKSKLDIHGNQPSPEKREEIHQFLDEIVHTDQDPFHPKRDDSPKKTRHD